MKTAFSITATFLILILFTLAPAVAQEGPDEVESNDEMGLADEIDGLIIEGEIGRRGDDHDWFVLTGQEGINPTFTLYYEDSDCDIDAEIWSDDEMIGSLTMSSSPDSGSFDVPGTCYIHVYIFDGYGEYTVEIEPGDRNRGDSDRRRRNDCEGVDEDEPNDSRSSADLIDAFEIEGYACEGEDDWFQLDGQEGYYPYITLNYDDNECDIDLEIYSSRDLVGELTSSSSPDGDDFEVGEVCYLHVWAFSGEGDYYIEIEPEGDPGYDFDDCEGLDEVEPNDSKRSADLIGVFEIEGYACQDDVDWFKLDGQEGYYPYITVYYDSDDVDIDVEVYSDSDMAGSLTSGISPDSGEFDVEGVCYLRVWAFSGEGEYYIEIEPADDTDNNYDEDCQGPDEWEPNDDSDLADSISGYEISGFACVGDDDWFVLEGQEGRRPEITLNYDEQYCDIDLEVYSDDEMIGSLTLSSSPDWDEFRIPGTCYIHVWAYDGEGEYYIEIEP